ncbi:phosphatase PAP2 family protein [Curtobacterium sp. MCBD17_028]|uniref:phosphatase PAP2 family protein n=1 Tax=Curtobacterium sp. MCBD17_028 TaxID=2175670 RepID=UPI000DA8F038|nr:phosphatase PAP2 family protein [Curtobacterium sp. MCBD17_028]PZE23116.1 hypothetical protein DEI86_15450 [Curtobacterium sp. MCBD17_028]
MDTRPRTALSRARVATAGAVLVALVLVGVVITHDADWHAAELAVDQAAIDGAPPWAHAIALVIGNTLAPGGATVIVLVIAAITWAVRRRSEAVLTSLALTVVPWWATEALKLIVERPRPAVRGVAAISTPSTWSYPSGHAAVATALVIGVLVLLAPTLRERPVARRVAIGLGVVVVGVVAVSRVVLAVHYPSDVVAGPLCAAAFAVIVGEIRRAIMRRSGRASSGQ